MNYVSAENLTKSFGVKTLFEGIQFHINEGDKIALVAKNGTGKSTLFKILNKQETTDSGEILINKEIQVIYFDQNIAFDPQLSISDFMMSLDSPPILALKNYQKALISLDDKEMELSLNAMEIHKAWDLENEMEQLLTQLKITDLSKKMGKLSGGEIKRVALAKLLLEVRAEHQHCLLMMDEPTNHLDLPMVEWLENYLNKAKITLLLITHDRYFLDSVCDYIWELEDKSLYYHKGGYAQFLENKAIRMDNMASTVDKANNLYRKELEWMRRQPKARTTKSKSRIDAFFETEKTAKTDLSEQKLELNFEMKRMGNKILELQNLNKSFGSKKILDHFSYNFQRGEKIGVIGKNGVGKSTLLNIIQGIETADAGKIETGETIVFGYFSQKGLEFNEDQKVIDFVKDIAEYYPLSNGKSLSASQFLRLFLFEDASQYTPISKLSGGEKRRLHLLSILFKNPNFLILDEPTNDLDLPTLSVLENFLTQFQGCLMIVSHDRYFMDRLVDHLFVFEGDGEITDFVGNFSEYREQEKNQTSTSPKAEISLVPEIKIEKSAPTISSNKSKKKLSFKEQRELEQMDVEMPKLEKKRDAILNDLNQQTEYAKIAELTEKLQNIQNELDKMELRWLDLQDED